VINEVYLIDTALIQIMIAQATPVPLLAERVLVEEGSRYDYYNLPTFVVADVLREEGDKIIVRTEDGLELEKLKSAAFCVDFSEDIEKARSHREAYQKALDALASELQDLRRYDKALVEALSPKNPLTPTIVAAEDPEGGFGVDHVTWQPLQTKQEIWIYFPVERIEVTKHIEGQGLIPKDPSIPPIQFQNAFTCESDEEWEIIKALSDAVSEKQKAFMGQLRSLETYYDRAARDIAIEAEAVVDESPETASMVDSQVQSALGGLSKPKPAVGGLSEGDSLWAEGILLELELANQNQIDVEQEAQEVISEDKEKTCAEIIKFLSLSGCRKLDQALWMLKYQVLENKRSSRFGNFENICQRMWELGVLSFKPNNARNYALGYEERRGLEAEKIIEPSQVISTATLLELRQIKDIEDKREVVREILASGELITKDRIKDYKERQRQLASSNRSSSARSTTANTQEASAEAHTPSTIIEVNSKVQIVEGDIVETLPGAKYIGSTKELPVGTKGMAQSVGEPAKQCIFVHKENPDNMGYIRIDHLKKVVSPSQTQNYSQVVEESSELARLEKVIAKLEDRNRQLEEELQKVKEDAEKKIKEAQALNDDVISRFTEMGRDPKNRATLAVHDATNVLQRYEDEYSITTHHPDVANLYDDIWAALKKATVDPVEDKVLG
jgi:predicted  nucleic acid-binding Zn-ribbon protein